jgi:hypothetical protein
MRRAPRTVAIVSGVLATSFAAIGIAADATNGELSIEETQARLTSQVARESQVAAGDLRMIEASPQTWPDSSLGCPGRRRTLGTSPVPGYRFVLDAAGERRIYHADTRGRIVRCDVPSKALDPIAR